MATLPAPLLDVTPLGQAGPPGNDPTAVQAASAAGALSESSLRARSRRFWEQERQMAQRILSAPKGSPQRAAAVREAYDTVATFRAAILGSAEALPVMGLDRRYTQLVGQILRRQQAAGMRPALFEVGYGCGQLLKQVVEMGFPATGIEVSPALRRRAVELLGPEHDANLLLGNLLECPAADDPRRYSLVYWNDVFEHIPPDEILDFLRKIHSLLLPGGQLLTITPNWHMRPNDVTRDVFPPRTEASGLHLREYTLGEVTALLRQAGFAKIAAPLLVSRRKIFLCGAGLAFWKRRFEPWLECLPLLPAQLLCRGWGLSITLATRR
jgi:SAM-dependent methyltransferase